LPLTFCISPIIVIAFNNMPVKVQDPSCSSYATARDWYDRFRRTLKPDARPMLTLAPMRPVRPVFDLDQSQGGRTDRVSWQCS
jgi:hypothetical protein